jgi:hypothetical protein
VRQPEKPRRSSPIVQLGGTPNAHWVAAGLWVVAGGLRLIGPRGNWLAWACFGMAVLTVAYYRSNPDPNAVTVPDDMKHQADEYRTMYVNQLRAGRGWQLALGVVFVLTGIAQLLSAIRPGLSP